MKFSEKLIKLRKEKGLSQEELGYEIKVSRQAISKWESEQSNPELEKIKEISKFFNVSIDYLLNDDVEECERPVITEKRKSKLLILLIIIFTIYIISVIYKFVGLTIFYNVANSFSENNYWVNISTEGYSTYSNASFSIARDINRVNNTYIEEIGTIDELSNSVPQRIIYIDKDNSIAYELNYNSNEQKYDYYEIESDINGYFDDNFVKTETLESMPKNRLLFAMNPLNFVSIKDKYIKSIYFTDGVKMVDTKYYDAVGLIWYIINISDSQRIETNYSYDYVQDHFDDRITSVIEEDEFNNRVIKDNIK